MPYERSKEEIEQALSHHDYLRQVGGFAMQHTIISRYSSSTVVSPPDTVVSGRWPAPSRVPSSSPAPATSR
jgi:hypothetical protein